MAKLSRPRRRRRVFTILVATTAIWRANSIVHDRYQNFAFSCYSKYPITISRWHHLRRGGGQHPPHVRDGAGGVASLIGTTPRIGRAKVRSLPPRRGLNSDGSDDVFAEFANHLSGSLTPSFGSSFDIVSDGTVIDALSSSFVSQGAELAVSFAVVTASDMIPFVPCQPIAIATAVKLGWIAYPITVAGQTTAGMCSFLLARTTADSGALQREMSKLNPETVARFEEFRATTLGASSDVNATDDDGREREILLALIGLRLAPFFPFSAGNYLLGGATSVGIRPFVLATVFGCMLSNIINIGVGVGGESVLSTIISRFEEAM